jgi:four helix bundle protein
MVDETSPAMSTFSEVLKERTMAFAVRVLRVVDALPRTPAGGVIAQQLAKAATSVAANYRASCNARSRREFIARLGIVVEEADEAACWLELIERGAMLPAADLTTARREALELRNIFGKSLGTARANARTAIAADCQPSPRQLSK